MAKKEKKKVANKAVEKQVPSELSKSTIDMVVENSIALQKVVTQLASEMKSISKDVSEMLELFKEAAKSVSSEKTEAEVKKSDVDELKSKIDELIEQNKIIAKGILLLESSISPKEKYPAGY